MLVTITVRLPQASCSSRPSIAKPGASATHSLTRHIRQTAAKAPLAAYRGRGCRTPKGTLSRKRLLQRLLRAPVTPAVPWQQLNSPGRRLLLSCGYRPTVAPGSPQRHAFVSFAISPPSEAAPVARGWAPPVHAPDFLQLPERGAEGEGIMPGWSAKPHRLRRRPKSPAPQASPRVAFAQMSVRSCVDDRKDVLRELQSRDPSSVKPRAREHAIASAFTPCHAIIVSAACSRHACRRRRPLEID